MPPQTVGTQPCPERSRRNAAPQLGKICEFESVLRMKWNATANARNRCYGISAIAGSEYSLSTVSTVTAVTTYE